MKAIIAQAGAYYGISVVLVDDETAEKVVRKVQDQLYSPSDIGEGIWAYAEIKDESVDTGSVSIIICDVKNQRFGFDTGMMKKGFELIDKLLA